MNKKNKKITKDWKNCVYKHILFQYSIDNYTDSFYDTHTQF